MDGNISGLNRLQHSVVHRLPQSYRWSNGLIGMSVEPRALVGEEGDDDLIGLRLLSHDGELAWEVMHGLQMALAEVQVFCTVVEWEGQPCLFVQRTDECTTTCRLKNFGVGIAETFSLEP